MMDNYEDIIALPHHVSQTRPQMPMQDRAAQFSPFSALTGYDDAIKETARLTSQRIELDEYEKQIINDRLQILCDNIESSPRVRITYFQPDAKKEGGAYVTIENTVKKLDSYQGILTLSDGLQILLDSVLDLTFAQVDDNPSPLSQ